VVSIGNDKTVREAFVCIMEYIETGGVVMWWPKINFSAKAPKDDWAAMEKVFLTMMTSLRINPRWMVEYAIMVDKAAIGIGEVDAYCRKIDEQITANRAKTNIEIHRQMQPQLLPWHDYTGSDGRLYYLDTTKSHSMHESGLIFSGDEYLDHLAGWKRMAPHIAKD
jgi:hypothetical protein